MFTITFTTDLPAKCAAAAQRIDAEQAALLQEIGIYVLQRQKFHFENKSRGGGGDDGQAWKPLALATEKKKAAKKRRGKRRSRARASAPPKSQIGVDTGVLRNSSTPGYAAPDGDGGTVFIVSGTTLTVGYQREYGKFFDAVRPLMPDPIPPDWHQGIDDIVADWLEDIVSPLGR